MDSEAFSETICKARDRAGDAAQVVEAINTKYEKNDCGEKNSEAGLSFLELKNHVMLEYLSDLTYVMLRKSFGKTIGGDPAIERIVEARTVLEKIRPIDKKLKYQIDKAVKVAETGTMKADDPMNFKPNIQALQDDLEDDDDDEDDEEDEEGKVDKNAKYVPPKHVPAYYEETNPEEEEKDQQSKLKKRTISKSILEDLKRQHLDTPEEEFNHVDTVKAKQIAKMKERIRYEEDNFMRLPMTKKDKHKGRQMTTMGTLGDELTYFGDNNFYNNTEGKKRKGGAGGKGKGAARKKFKRH